jgi:hypothetical protein
MNRILVARSLILLAAVVKDDAFKVIADTNAYKQVTRIRRIPIARMTDPKTKKETIIVGNKEIAEYGLTIPGKGYLSDSDTQRLFSDEVVIEEKMDGHPVVVVFGGYTFYCESLSIKHTVEYDNIPYSEQGWPDMTVVYEVMEGEFDNPGSASGQWLTRNEKVSVCQMVGAPVSKLLFKGKIRPDEIPAVADRVSSFGGSKIEGVVVKNLSAGVFGKFINLEFQKKISDEVLQQGVHPMQKGERNIRRQYRPLVHEEFGV